MQKEDEQTRRWLEIWTAAIAAVAQCHGIAAPMSDRMSEEWLQFFEPLKGPEEDAA
jgi:hypothetical protein